MSSMAEFTVDPVDFPLGSVFESIPAATVELERIVPTNKYVVPYIWVWDAETDDIEAAFTDHPALVDIERIDTIDSNHLIRVVWNPEHATILSLIAESTLTLLSATGSGDHWVFRVRARDHKTLSTFQKAAYDHGIPIEFTTVRRFDGSRSDHDYEPTEAQWEALVLAHQRGYYSTPREVTLEEIATEIGISRQALASRLRRGTDRLISNALR